MLYPIIENNMVILILLLISIVMKNKFYIFFLICNSFLFYRDTMQMLKSHGKGVLTMVLCIIVWPIVPNWICDFFFYVALYFSPYSNLEKLYKIMKGWNCDIPCYVRPSASLDHTKIISCSLNSLTPKNC